MDIALSRAALFGRIGVAEKPITGAPRTYLGALTQSHSSTMTIAILFLNCLYFPVMHSLVGYKYPVERGMVLKL